MTKRRTQPFLEHFPQKGGPPHRIVLERFPFQIGRSQEADHTLYSREVSSLHAELVQAGEGYVLRDLGSTNGTFVNGERTEQRWLRPGDIIHIAEEELRFGLFEGQGMREPTLASPEDRQQRLIRETNDLSRVVANRAVSAVFQPIITLTEPSRVIGYEALGRITLQGYTVGELLRIANERGEGATLSRMLRSVALADLALLPERPVSIFFNLHPTELSEPERLEEAFVSIAAALAPEQRAILEVHEGAVTDLAVMRWIRERSSAAGIGLAYDDFGAGQSRLMELVEVPPDVIKLDMALIRDIDQSKKREDLVRALVAVMRDMGIQVLAEGIERAEEAAVCRELGCALAQGYLFGRPAPVR
jgi:EAL domain-containing protein (putative c-di-GMP-specific phosphodiesterase class I)